MIRPWICWRVEDNTASALNRSWHFISCRVLYCFVVPRNIVCLAFLILSLLATSLIKLNPNLNLNLFEIATKRVYSKSQNGAALQLNGRRKHAERPQLACSPVTSHLWRVSRRAHFITRRWAETHCWTSSDKRRTTHLRSSACCITTIVTWRQPPQQISYAHRVFGGVAVQVTLTSRDEIILGIPMGPVGPMRFPWEWESLR